MITKNTVCWPCCCRCCRSGWRYETRQWSHRLCFGHTSVCWPLVAAVVVVVIVIVIVVVVDRVGDTKLDNEVTDCALVQHQFQKGYIRLREYLERIEGCGREGNLWLCLVELYSAHARRLASRFGFRTFTVQLQFPKHSRFSDHFRVWFGLLRKSDDILLLLLLLLLSYSYLSLSL